MAVFNEILVSKSTSDKLRVQALYKQVQFEVAWMGLIIDVSWEAGSVWDKAFWKAAHKGKFPVCFPMEF